MEAEFAVLVEYPMKRLMLIIVAVHIALIAGVTQAHHGTRGTYDMDKPITLRGAVTEFKFVNPHVLISFDVKGESWLAEGPSVINWTKTGWNRNSIKAGDQVAVTLFPSRSGKREGVLQKIVNANGKEWCCETK